MDFFLDILQADIAYLSHFTSSPVSFFPVQLCCFLCAMSSFILVSFRCTTEKSLFHYFNLFSPSAFFLDEIWRPLSLDSICFFWPNHTQKCSSCAILVLWHNAVSISISTAAAFENLTIYQTSRVLHHHNSY